MIFCLPYLLKRRHRQNNLFSLPSHMQALITILHLLFEVISHTYILSLTNHQSYSSFVPLLSHPSPFLWPSSLFPLIPFHSFLSLSPVPYFNSWFLSQHSAEDGIDGTIGLFRRNFGCSAVQETLLEFRSEPFPGKETTLNSVLWYKNRRGRSTRLSWGFTKWSHSYWAELNSRCYADSLSIFSYSFRWVNIIFYSIIGAAHDTAHRLFKIWTFLWF